VWTGARVNLKKRVMSPCCCFSVRLCVFLTTVLMCQCVVANVGIHDCVDVLMC
jgi:hypothetical protein